METAEAAFLCILSLFMFVAGSTIVGQLMKSSKDELSHLRLTLQRQHCQLQQLMEHKAILQQSANYLSNYISDLKEKLQEFTAKLEEYKEVTPPPSSPHDDSPKKQTKDRHEVACRFVRRQRDVVHDN